MDLSYLVYNIYPCLIHGIFPIKPPSYGAKTAKCEHLTAEIGPELAGFWDRDRVQGHTDHFQPRSTCVLIFGCTHVQNGTSKVQNWNCSDLSTFRAFFAQISQAKEHMAMGQNRGTLVNIKIDGKWMFIHPNMAP